MDSIAESTPPAWHRWVPIRKIGAAATTALGGEAGALTLYFTGAIDGRALLAATVTAVVPVVVGYWTHDMPRKARRGSFTLDPDPHEMRVDEDH